MPRAEEARRLEAASRSDDPTLEFGAEFVSGSGPVELCNARRADNGSTPAWKASERARLRDGNRFFEVDDRPLSPLLLHAIADSISLRGCAWSKLGFNPHLGLPSMPSVGIDLLDRIFISKKIGIDESMIFALISFFFLERR